MGTIFVTMVLLLAAGLIALYTNRSAIVEQRLTARAIRAAQALAAANAGIDHALAYIRNGGVDHDHDGQPDTIAANTLARSGGSASYYRVAYVDSTSTPPACPATHGGSFAAFTAPTLMTQVAAVSCGWSDDDSSVQRVVQLLTATPSTAGAISTPLVTRGATDLLTGGASILNYFNDLTVWSGGSLLGQSNTGKTFVRDVATRPVANVTDDYRNTGSSPSCNNPPAGYSCSTQGSTMGHDTVSGDTSLSTKTPDQYFQFFFGLPPAVYRDNIATWVVDPAATLPNRNSTSIAGIAGMTSNVIWIEGNATLPGDLGTADKPVILIVNGTLALGSNSVVNGLVYASGEITGNGGPTIYGALLGAGGASTTGNLKVVYDPRVLGAVSNLGRAAKLQGSWRDW